MTKTLWKDLLRAIQKSKGRFISLFLLMALGSFTLIGLKVTGPNMKTSANHFINEHKLMDLSVIASNGFNEQDKKELKQLKGGKIEYSYLLDANFGQKEDAIRLFSRSKSLSEFQLVKGRYPKNNKEIALAPWLEKTYAIGDQVKITTSEEKLLRSESFRVVGYMNSSEVWSKNNLGTSQSGDGHLSAYALIADSAFNIPKNLVRISYSDLRGINAFSKTYEANLQKHEEVLTELFSDNGKEADNNAKKISQEKLKAAEKNIEQAKSDLLTQEKALDLLPPSQKESIQNQINKGKQNLKQEEDRLIQKKVILAELPKATYAIFNRHSLPGGEGYHIYDTSLTSIAMVSNIFPLVLYLVAALVAFTTMTRFVDEERQNSGLLLAIGYSEKAILAKFLIYGLLASFLGTTLGILGGSYFLSKLIAEIITKPMVLGQTSLYFYVEYAGLAYFLAILSAILPGYVIVGKEINQVPAELLLAKPPVKGAKLVLERIPLLWDRFSFTYKVTLRNIFRYKQRMLMTIFGVAGSVALLFSGLGIQSSLSKVLEHQFQDLSPYDMLLVENPFSDKKAKDSLSRYLKSTKVDDYQSVSFASPQLKIKGQGKLSPVSILATNSANLEPYLNLYDIASHRKIDIDSDGIIMSEKLAAFYHVKAGQKLTLKDNQKHQVTVTLSHIIDMNVGHYIIMNQNYYENHFKDFESNKAYLINLNKEESLSKNAKLLLSNSSVKAISQNAQIVKSVKEVVRSLNHVMTLLVILSLLLASVILYNLTTINISERIRELSTIKVLGFYDNEVGLYIYRETIILSLLGILFGVIGGKQLHALIMSLIRADNMHFGREVEAYVYLLPILAVSLLILSLGILVHHRLKQLDMLEALKSVD